MQSTCGGRNEQCIASGPGRDMFGSMRIIGEHQYRSARALFDAPNSTFLTIDGPIRVVHQFVDMSREVVDAKWTSTGKTAKTCPSALGDSFAAGTTDGPGAFDFKQGTNGTGNEFWVNLICLNFELLLIIINIIINIIIRC